MVRFFIIQKDVIIIFILLDFLSAKTFEVPFPPEHLQLEFERRIQFISSIQQQQESALANSMLVFTSLLGKSFSLSLSWEY